MNVRASIAQELHKQARKNFHTRYVELKGLNDLYQADLVEMIPFSRINKGYKYIMTIINCFSKFAIAVPLKSKKAKEVEIALKPVLLKHSMRHFQTDQGSEWFNLNIKSLLNKFNINHYYTFSNKKASIIERFNRTIKGKMWRLFSEQGSYKWIYILPKLLNEYNNTVHRTIGMKPKDVNEFNEKEVLKRIIKGRKMIKTKQKFAVGDYVRISRATKEFNKGYWPRWSNEIYTVEKVQPTTPITYTIKDYRGDVLKGGFYQEELNKTNHPDSYLIEKVVRRKGDKLLVRWLGFDKSHDSWINKKELLK